MQDYQEVLLFTVSFIIIALAAKQIGQILARIKLPLISGFLFAGILVGPFVLGLIPAEAIEKLRFVDEVSLAVIAFAAGSELYLKELSSRFRSIAWVTIGNAVAIPIVGGLTILALANFIPFMQSMPVTGKIAISLLAGAILVARSPSSAIAIVNELRAKGPFTQTALGVTMVTDVVVIVLFAVSSEIANALLTGLSFNLGFVTLLVGELLLSLAIGYILGKLLQLILSLHASTLIKSGMILLAGYGIFALSAIIRDVSHESLPFEVLLEPLLICMIGSFVVTNYSSYRAEFLKILHDVGPPIYVAFFTLTGASLALDILVSIWPIALALFVVRLAGIFIGSFTGGVLAGDPMSHNRLSWMAYVTQAGVGLGLAKEAAVAFPQFGSDFATLIISTIVISQIIGPPLIKWVISRVGEAHARAETAEFDGVRDAIIFGLEGQALALAHQLQAHGWQVKVASRKVSSIDKVANSDIFICPIADLSLDTLRQLDAGQADAIIALLSDEENYQICEVVYEHFGIETVVVRLNDRANFDRFHELGALIVDPSTAIVSLLEHFVRSPSATSLLLGMEEHQDIVDLEVCNPSLHDLTLRDLRLPLDTIILSVRRNGHLLISHGYTQLKLGDRVTVVGSQESLEEVMLRFEG
jgi:Trk K+ transport system NAD-binding subunit/Kef-type K+ transport system membrane component KefB